MSQKLLSAPHEQGMLPPPRKPQRHGIPFGVYLALIAVLLVAGCGIISRWHAGNKLATQTRKDAAVTVTVVKPTVAPATDEINLPGTIQAFVDAPIYARVGGYLKNWYADIGAHVKKGQLMAEIETPEVDQQLQQAVANLATSKANLELADITNKRWQALVKTNAVSKQDADEKQGALDAQRAQYAAADANVRQLRATQSFQKIYAPFDGVVTVRNTDIGQLINAGQGVGPQLFRVASVDKLRTFIPVPQSQSPYVKPGMTADLHFEERPGKGFAGTVTRTSNSIDTTSRTLLTEVDIDNTSGELFPGAYVDVHIKLPSPATEGAVRIPANTLIFRAAGLQVAVVGQDGKIALKDIVIGRDFGNEVEIVKGLTADDRVVINPPDSLSAGQQVQVAPPPTEGTDAAQDGHQSKPDDSKGKNDPGKKSDSKSGDSGGGSSASGGGTAGGGGSATGGGGNTGNSVDGMGGKGNLGSEDPASNGGGSGTVTGTGGQDGSSAAPGNTNKGKTGDTGK
jgi:RND family efflux transporter MFP subunit